MSLFYKKSANHLFDEKKMPKGRVVNGVAYAGYGKWSVFGGYEYPLVATLKNGKICCEKWAFDETKIVAKHYINNNKKYSFYGTLEELFHETFPYIHLIKMSEVKEKLNNLNSFLYSNGDNSIKIELNQT